jgi:hypothetical protein
VEIENSYSEKAQHEVYECAKTIRLLLLKNRPKMLKED